MSDILDILNAERSVDSQPTGKQKMKAPQLPKFKKPEGMKRELYNLLQQTNSNPTALIQSDFALSSKIGYPEYGYKKVRVDLTARKVRKWVWTPYSNPARKDQLKLYHWKREMERNQDSAFMKLNVQPDVPTYDSEQEYIELNLQTDKWDKHETDYLLRMMKHHDMLFVVVHDRWDAQTYKKRTLEEIKERYYAVYNAVKAKRDPKYQAFVYDSEHETTRKSQLEMLWNRSAEEVKEEERLSQELKKIEQKKKEREKKKQDLVKLINAADTTTEIRRNEQQTHKQIQQSQSRSHRKKTAVSARQSSKFDSSLPSIATPNIENAGIKFPETKASGVWLRSARMKLPASVGQKKTKAISQLLTELEIDPHPMPTEEICQHFNEVRSDMVILYELKLALASLEFELHSLRHQAESDANEELEKTIQAMSCDASLPPPTPTTPAPSSASITVQPASSGVLAGVGAEVKAGSGGSSSSSKKTEFPSPKKSISEVIDVSALATPRKRKAALEQENLMRSLRKN